MNLWKIAESVGAGIISAVVPGGGAILGVVNALLPDDKKLSATATGHQVTAAVNSLPPAEQAQLRLKEFDVTLEQIRQDGDTLRAMLTADATMPHTTRPYIAKGSFIVVAFSIIAVVSLWVVSVFNESTATIKAVTDGWPFILAVLAPLVTLLHAYFGVLKHEHRNKLDAANGTPTAATGLAGIISSLVSK